MKNPDREYMKLKTLVKYYEPSYSESWEEWWKESLANPFAPTRRLMKDLEERGEFDFPVVLNEGYKDGGDYIPPTVSEGMHRLAAYYHSDREEVMVSYAGEVDDSTLVDSIITVELKASKESLDELHENVYGILSWRYTESARSAWVSAEASSSYGMGHEEFYLYLRPEITIDCRKFHKEVSERLSVLDVEVLAIKQQYFDEEASCFVDLHGNRQETHPAFGIFPI